MPQINRILVTGGAGFLGSHLCERLVDDGHDVVKAHRGEEALEPQADADGAAPGAEGTATTAASGTEEA